MNSVLKNKKERNELYARKRFCPGSQCFANRLTKSSSAFPTLLLCRQIPKEKEKQREREREEATSGGLILPVSALRVKGRICLREISLNHVPSLFLVLLILHVSGHAWRRDGSVWPDGYSNSAVWFEAPSFILCSLTVLT